MKIDKLILGDFKTNCYVISHDNTAIVVDPSCNGEAIDELLRKNDLKLKAILLTHGHQDHIGAVDYLYNQYKCTILCHILEKDIVTAEVPSKLVRFPSFEDIKVVSPIKYFEGDFNKFDIDGIIVDAILTPGHSEGSVTYVLRNYKRIFSGDTLFNGGVGRVDFPTSDPAKMKESLEIYKNFKDDCKILPGHGSSSTIGEEKINNPYLN